MSIKFSSSAPPATALSKTGKRRPARAWLSSVAFVLLAVLLFPGHAHACFYTGISAPIPVPFPLSGTYTIPRDAPIGTVIATIVAPAPVASSLQIASCSENTVTQTITSTVTPHGGQELTYRTYPTNIPGIGARIYSSTSTPSNAYPGTATSTSTNGFGGYMTHGYTMQFVKVATATGSGMVQAADVVSMAWDYNGLVLANLFATGSIQFVTAACQTPDVQVWLKKWPTTTFTGVGSTSAAVPFSIQLNNCAAGMNSIQYRIDPATTVVDSANSVVALDPSSSAAGVGVQILNSTGTTAVPLQSWLPVSGYNTTNGGSLTIPLSARYRQTSSTVTPGVANTYVTFTMSYQ